MITWQFNKAMLSFAGIGMILAACGGSTIRDLTGKETSSLRQSNSSAETNPSASGNEGEQETEPEVVLQAQLVADVGDTLTFDPQEVFVVQSKLIGLANEGSLEAKSLAAQIKSGESFQFTGGEFPGTGGDCSSLLPAGATCRLEVQVTSAKGGSYSDELSILYSSGDEDKSMLINLTSSVTDPLAENLFLHYDFANEGEAPVDATGQGRDGTLQGGLAIADGQVNADGSDDHVELGHQDGLNFSSGFAMTIWFKVSDLSGTATRSLVSRVSGGGYGLWFHGPWVAYHDEVNFILHNGAGYERAFFPISDLTLGEWAHLAGTFDGNEMRIYLNGQLKHSHSIPGSILTANNCDLFLGAECAGGAGVDPVWFYGGGMDEFRLYNASLDADQVKAIYDRGR